MFLHGCLLEAATGKQAASKGGRKPVSDRERGSHLLQSLEIEKNQVFECFSEREKRTSHFVARRIR
jgi:hypothetical protein